LLVFVYCAVLMVSASVGRAAAIWGNAVCHAVIAAALGAAGDAVAAAGA
jgi:hypothetical protein